MNERIKDKIAEIRDYLNFLMQSKPETFEEYNNNRTIIAICERYCEKVIEAVVDLVFLFIKIQINNKLKGFKLPESDSESFEVLANHGIISKTLAENLIKAKGMRNFIVHEYGKIDNEVVFNSIHNQLENDINELINNIETALNKTEEIKDET